MVTSVNQFVNHMEVSYPDRIACQWVDNDTGEVLSRTYTEYVRDIRHFAGYLMSKYPDARGKHIGVLSMNSYHYAVALMGTLLAGAVVVPINHMETLNNVEYAIELADIEVIFHDGTYIAEENEFVKYRHMLVDIDAYTKAPCGEYAFEDSDNEALAMMIFTSGTTGHSKAVMLSNRAIFAPISGMIEYTKTVKLDVMKMMISMPMFHVSSIAPFFVHGGMGNTLGINTDMKYLYRDIKKLDCVMANIVPMVMYSFEKDLKRGRKSRLGTLKSLIVGAAKPDDSIFSLFLQNGIFIAQAYGLSEVFGGGTTNSSIEPKHFASVGKPISGVEIKIEDEEICIKSRGMMTGYYKDPEATAAVIRDGWLYTGDLGYMDEDGYLYITGRKKNLIILASGENVSPEELELLLMDNSAVKEVLVKEKSGRICAEIFCDEAEQENLSRYVNELNGTLPMYKRMTCVEFRSEPFEKTGSGKIKRI